MTRDPITIGPDDSLVHRESLFWNTVRSLMTTDPIAVEPNGACR